jgi:hypothetical protein
MISINSVRNLTLFLLNKSNRGYIGVDEFNSFCQLAQLSIFEDLFTQYNAFINKENRRLTGTEYANLPKNLREQIDVFAEYTTQANFTYNSLTDLWSYTGTDLYRAENLSLVNADAKKVDIDEVQKRELNVMMNSPLTTPSVTFPVYTRIGASFRIVPIIENPSYAELFYIRTPKNPKWTFTTVAGNPIFNPSASDFQDIELHISLFDAFVVKVLSYCGLSIREAEVTQIANSQEVQEFQKQNA